MGQPDQAENIIVLNGKRYDAATGREIPQSQAPERIKAHPVHLTNTATHTVLTPKPIQPAQHVTVLHKKPEPKIQADTVLHPEHKIKVHSDSEQKNIHVDVSPVTVDIRKRRADAHRERIKRAELASRSRAVSRFNSHAQHDVIKSAPVPMADIANSQTASRQQAVKIAAMAPAKAPPYVLPTTDTSLLSTFTDEPQKLLEDGGKPKLLTRGKNFMHSIGQFFAVRSYVPKMASVLSVLLLAGYITYLNIPNLALRVAASRAGFDATMPAYAPGEYAFEGPIQYTQGQIILDFTDQKSNSYAVKQSKSNWDSKSLLENYVKDQSDDYVTFEKQGLTMYVFNDNVTTWVNGGVWYTIEGADDLQTDELVRIATSL